jgi:branched-chain amino acid transport system permease protein
MLTPRNIVFLVGVVIVLIVPFAIPNPYLLQVIILIFMYVGFSQGWNILGGYAGQHSLHHAIFVAMGAYTASLLYLKFGINPWLTIPIGGIPALALAVLLGYTCFHLRGGYFALATLAFGLALNILFTNWDYAGGAMGLILKPPPGFEIGTLRIDFAQAAPNYYVALLLAVITIYVMQKVVKSRIGLKMLSIREDEDAAESLGVNVFRTKLYAAMLSGFFPGIIGGFYAFYFVFIEPDSVISPLFSLEIMLAAILGGTGTIAGPIIGSVIVVALSEYMRATLGFTAGWYLLIYGILLMAGILVMPEGIYGFITKTRKSGIKASLTKTLSG